MEILGGGGTYYLLTSLRVNSNLFKGVGLGVLLLSVVGTSLFIH